MEQNQAEQELNNRIGHLQVILCILVMFVHFRNTDIFPDEPKAWLSFLQDTEVVMLGTTAVAGFFVVSGYRFASNLSMKTIGGKLKKRVFSLLIPYLIWNFIYSLYAFVMAAHPFLNRFADSKSVSIPEFLLGIIDSARYNPVFWYMKFLMIMIVIAGAFFAIFRKKNAFVILFFLNVIGAVTAMFVPRIPSFLYSFLLWSVFFTFGMILGHFGENEEASRPVSAIIEVVRRALNLSGALPFISALIIYVPFSVWYYYDKRAFSFLGYHAAYLFLLWSITGFLKEKKPTVLASMTFFLYASHWLIARNLNKLFCVTFNTTKMLPGFICYCLLPFAVILIGSGAFWLGKTKFFKSVWKVLNGGR